MFLLFGESRMFSFTAGLLLYLQKNWVIPSDQEEKRRACKQIPCMFEASSARLALMLDQSFSLPGIDYCRE